MSKVIEIGNIDQRARIKQSRKIANHLRDLADLIHDDKIEIEPTAMLLVISGKEYHEVLQLGYKNYNAAISASKAALSFNSKRKAGVKFNHDNMIERK